MRPTRSGNTQGQYEKHSAARQQPHHASESAVGGGLAIPLAFAVVLLCSYLMLAFVVGWWPFVPLPSSTCPANTTAYQVFEDGTGSTQDRSNWEPAAEGFVNGLQPCDCVSFYHITDNTPNTTRAAKPVSMPEPVDANASSFDRARQKKALDDAREKILAQLQKLIDEKSDAGVSDILGVFHALRPMESSSTRNVLVVFSDGFESKADGINLENKDIGQKTHECADDKHLPALLEAVMKDNRGRPKDLARYEQIVWVFPTKAGNGGCNSFLEIKRFWASVLESWSLSMKLNRPPRLIFEINAFEGDR